MSSCRILFGRPLRLVMLIMLICGSIPFLGSPNATVAQDEPADLTTPALVQA